MKENQNCQCPLAGLTPEAVDALRRLATRKEEETRLAKLSDRVLFLITEIREEEEVIHAAGLGLPLRGSGKLVRAQQAASRMTALASEFNDLMLELIAERKGGLK